MNENEEVMTIDEAFNTDDSGVLETVSMSGLNVYDVNELMALDIPEQDVILEPWLKVGSITLISGNSGCLKTYFSLGICQSIINGIDFGVFVPRKKVNILYIDGELPPRLLLDRISQLQLVEPERMSVISKGLNLNSVSCNISDEWFRSEVVDICVQKDIGLVVIDNLSCLTVGSDENSKQSYDEISQWLLELRHKGCSSLVIHHNNKNGSQRGSSSKIDTVDSHISLNRQDMAVNRITINFMKYRYEQEERVCKRTMEMVCENAGLRWIDSRGDQYDLNREVLILLNRGKMNQCEIGDLVGKDRTTVSKIKSKSIKDGHFTKNNDFTDEGSQFYEIEETSE